MTISVIIATYNRAALLDDCLAHLARQPFERGDEVIIVDNGSTDSTPEIVVRHERAFSVAVRHLTESRPGKSHALARALAIATGDVFAFIDDDVNVDGRWLGEVRHIMAGGVALMGGAVAPRWERRAPRWLRLTGGEGYGRLASPLALLDYGDRSVALGSRTVLGANLAVRRDVIAQVGGFATHLGKLRGTLLSGEDHDLCRRVQAAGLTAMYQPSAVVRHWVPADRMRVLYFFSWFFWSGITNAELDENAARRARSIFGLPLYLVRRFVAGAVRAVGAVACGRLDSAVEQAIDCAFAAGYAAKKWRLVTLEIGQPRAARQVL